MFELFASMIANDLMGDALKDLGLSNTKGLLGQVTSKPEMAAPGATPGAGYEDTNAGMADAANQLEAPKPNIFASALSLASNPNANMGDLLKGTEYEKYAPYASFAFAPTSNLGFVNSMPMTGNQNNLARQAYGRYYGN